MRRYERRLLAQVISSDRTRDVSFCVASVEFSKLVESLQCIEGPLAISSDVQRPGTAYSRSSRPSLDTRRRIWYLAQGLEKG
jgi:hypothetical protein